MRGPTLVGAVLLLVLHLGAGEPNPRYALWIRGLCGETIEGPAGSRFDDGTSGEPEFENRRPGHTFEIVLRKSQDRWDEGTTWGWSWAAGVEGPLTITDVTTEGTVSCRWSGDRPECVVGGCGFVRNELTGPPFGGGPQTQENHGALSAVALSFDHGDIRCDGDWPIGKLRVTADFPDTAGETVSGRLFFAVRAGETGGPVESGVVYSGLTVSEATGNPPLELQDCELRFRAVGPDDFIRCDATGDGVVNIADPIRILNQLFLGRTAPPCRAATDCNDDAETNVADAVYALSYLFRGAAAPPAPFPECGRPEGLEPEACPGGSTICSWPPVRR